MEEMCIPNSSNTKHYRQMQGNRIIDTMVLKIYADDMSANILDSIDPKMLARIQALRLMDDDFMTVVFSGDNKANLSTK